MKNTITRKTLKSLCNLNINRFDPEANARRILFWYRIFTLGRTPIVVISTTERKIGEPPSLTGAVRSLVDKCGLRVVVDSPPDSNDEPLVSTKRQSVINLQPMDKEMIWSLPQLEDLIKLTEEAGLDDVTWAILGGNPSSYEYLSFNLYRSEGQDKGKILGQLLCDEVFTAIELVRESRLNDGRMERILQFFDRKVGMIPCQVVDSQKIRRPTPDKVFRKVEKYGKSILILASNAINIILRYNLTKKPTMELANDLALKCVEQTSNGIH